MARRRPNPKKLLVASVGVATLNYLPTACSKDEMVNVANLMLTPPYGAGGGAGAGAADSGADAAKPAGTSTSIPPNPTVANLMAPAPPPQQNQSRSAPKGK